MTSLAALRLTAHLPLDSAPRHFTSAIPEAHYLLDTQATIQGGIRPPARAVAMDIRDRAATLG
jgi:hypothetical protein